MWWHTYVRLLVEGLGAGIVFRVLEGRGLYIIIGGIE